CALSPTLFPYTTLFRSNTALAAETGWNYESGIRWQRADRRFWLDGSLFYYRMNDAIIRQLRDNGAEYFGNAGAVEQRGAELSVRSEEHTSELQSRENLV